MKRWIESKFEFNGKEYKNGFEIDESHSEERNVKMFKELLRVQEMAYKFAKEGDSNCSSLD